MIRLTALKLVLALATMGHPADDRHRDQPKDEHHHHPIRCTRHAVASVYGQGDGQLGNTTASGRVYTAGLMGVAHKSIRLGARITLCYRAADHIMRRVRVRVWDRGPYVAGRAFDLMLAPQRALHFPTGVAALSWRYGP